MSNLPVEEKRYEEAHPICERCGTEMKEISIISGAYVIFPWNIREVFGKGRVKVHAEFDGIPYDGSIVNMGVKDTQGNVCYIIGVLKSVRKKLKKGDGDSIHIVIEERL